MKDAKFLIENHFYKNPLFKELNGTLECRELLKLMTTTHQSIINFCYVKGSVLYFVLKHPLALSELKRDSNINMIKGLLNIIVKTRQNSVFCGVQDIKFFVAKQIKFKKPPDPYSPNFIKQTPKSKAQFQNMAINEKIYNKFEELREILKRKNIAFK